MVNREIKIYRDKVSNYYYIHAKYLGTEMQRNLRINGVIYKNGIFILTELQYKAFYKKYKDIFLFIRESDDKEIEEKLDDPYAVLYLRKDAPPEIIRAVYGILTRKYHSDTGNGDIKKLQEVIDAYEKIKKKRND